MGKLYMPNDSPSEDALTVAARDLSSKVLSHSSLLYASKKDVQDINVDSALSRVVATLSNMLLTSNTKHLNVF